MAGGAAVGLDEAHRRGTTRQRLDAEGTRSGVGVEHRRALDRPEAGENVEDRLAHPIARRPQVWQVGSAEPALSRRASDNTHATTVEPRGPPSAQGSDGCSVAGSALEDEFLGLLGHEQVDFVCEQRVCLQGRVLVDDCLGHPAGRPDQRLVPAE